MGNEMNAGMGKARWGRLLITAALLCGTTGCWFGGGQDEEKIDPNEATARDAAFRTDAEKARDDRFKDRLKRRVHLDEPVR